jgi:hypothetical protein
VCGRTEVIDERLAGELRGPLDDRRFEPITLAEESHLLGASPAHLVWSYPAPSASPPPVPGGPAGRGRPAASARRAADRPGCGRGRLLPQAHFTRQFKRYVGHALSTGDRPRQWDRGPPADSVPAAVDGSAARLVEERLDVRVVHVLLGDYDEAGADLLLDRLALEGGDRLLDAGLADVGRLLGD